MELCERKVGLVTGSILNSLEERVRGQKEEVTVINGRENSGADRILVVGTVKKGQSLEKLVSWSSMLRVLKDAEEIHHFPLQMVDARYSSEIGDVGLLSQFLGRNIELISYGSAESLPQL